MQVSFMDINTPSQEVLTTTWFAIVIGQVVKFKKKKQAYSDLLTTYHKKVETIKIIQILAIDEIPRISRIFHLRKKESYLIIINIKFLSHLM